MGGPRLSSMDTARDEGSQMFVGLLNPPDLNSRRNPNRPSIC